MLPGVLLTLALAYHLLIKRERDPCSQWLYATFARQSLHTNAHWEHSLVPKNLREEKYIAFNLFIIGVRAGTIHGSSYFPPYHLSQEEPCSKVAKIHQCSFTTSAS
jgi:hypothetical protein